MTRLGRLLDPARRGAGARAAGCGAARQDYRAEEAIGGIVEPTRPTCRDGESGEADRQLSVSGPPHRQTRLVEATAESLAGIRGRW